MGYLRLIYLWKVETKKTKEIKATTDHNTCSYLTKEALSPTGTRKHPLIHCLHQQILLF
jgi:hypothetical protein